MNVGFWRGIMTDANGMWDVANAGLALVTALVLGMILYIGGMAFIDWLSCKPLLSHDGQVLLQSCRFEVRQVSEGVGLVCGGYSTALLALSAYMAATRRGHEPRGEGDVEHIPVKDRV